MPRYKQEKDGQMVMLPVSLEEQLIPGTLEWAIHHLVEERIDMKGFESTYKNEKTGAPAHDPRALLKAVLYAYSQGIMGSRRIERVCQKHITFIALTGGKAPDHSTIAAFVSRKEDEIVSSFVDILLVCEEEGLLGGTHLSIDGVKLPSNAAKEWSGTHEELGKKKAKLQQKVCEAVEDHKSKDKSRKDKDDPKGPGGGEQRIERLRQQAERIEKFLEENEPKEGSRGIEIQSNVTDNESAKMVTEHGVVQGYNANAAVDAKHQVVVYAEAFGRGSDSTHVKPMLEGAKKNLVQLGKEPDVLQGTVVTADSSYHSKKNLQACEKEQVDAYIPDVKFRKRDSRFANAERFRKPIDRKKLKGRKKPKRWFGVEDFTLDEKKGKLICPAGKELYLKNRNFECNGYKAVVYHGKKTECRACELRTKCLRKGTTQARQVYLFYESPKDTLTARMRRKIDTIKGRILYSKRLGIVEPVFANIRARKRLDRFLLRGKRKVNTQWTLFCMVHNIGKILRFGTSYA